MERMSLIIGASPQISPSLSNVNKLQEMRYGRVMPCHAKWNVIMNRVVLNEHVYAPASANENKHASKKT